jgi:lysozyme
MNDNDLHKVLMLNLKRDEGLRLKPYKDTEGILTIGYGRNLEHVGITEGEAENMLLRDIGVAWDETIRLVPSFSRLPWQAKSALVNMMFNLGYPRLSQFVRMLDAIDRDNFNEAADEALDSKWARQVGKRAERIAGLFRQAAGEE